MIDAGLHAAAESMGLNAPPLSPDPGQCWIIGPTPTGAWAGHAHALAAWTENGWRYFSARAGMRVWLVDQQIWAECVGPEWVAGELRGNRLLLDGTQVVGPQLSGIAAPSGGMTTDAEARAAIATIIARLTAHGLIAA